ncbi:dermonecrotic toxin domain-containing protein [Pseudomonas sp. R5(2019)]|uniref:dermonecrotic toxin domain-containing protein n=1 Tax=Pseudomonas sp. R5(2019) TaxID=2697566 RepID=UPI001411B873|nr:DUF6543 domain-containing protein [Pseudomonas sp. R5(2019)]NBA95458.1 membrane-targeted effector domain-containing toxin [Pseudomonas sp. R5(2019)]
MPDDFTPHILRPVDFSLDAWSPSSVQDVGLMLDSRHPWQTSRSTLHQLLEQAPGVRASIRQTLRDHLLLDAENSYLLSSSKDDNQPPIFINLACLCEFVRQHPDLPADLDQHWRIAGLPAGHALATLSPNELVAKLKTVHSQAAVLQHWAAYWDERAPGTPLPRRNHAIAQYRAHFQAAINAALAHYQLSLEQLRPAQAVIDSPEWLRLDNEKLYIETLKLPKPGALVISAHGTQAPQLLYLPWDTLPLRWFGSRLDMETFLHDQGSSLFGQTLTGHPLQYVGSDSGLAAGALEILEHWRNRLVAALQADHGSDLASQAEFALDSADLLDLHRRNPGVFAEAPVVTLEETEGLTDSFFDFGSLYQDIPYEIRLQQLGTQSKALANLTESECQTLAALHEALIQVRSDADTAAKALLAEIHLYQSGHREALLRPLYDARCSALRLEARIQRLLGQIDTDELAMIEEILAAAPAGLPSSSTTVAVFPELSEPAGAGLKALNGVILITRRAVLDDPLSELGLLVYWPGIGGGLLRCANRSALLRYFGIPMHASQSLLLKPAGDDPIKQSLDHQLQHAAQLYVSARANPANTPSELATALQEHHALILSQLQVPVHDARDLAYTLLNEQQLSATLYDSLPNWLRNLSEEFRQPLKPLINDYIIAMRRSLNLLERDLPARPLFNQARLTERLCKDFPDFDGSAIILNLPESVSFRKEPVAGGGAPGTPQKLVPLVSKKRVRLSLAELAMTHIDDTTRLRLNYLELEPQTGDATLKQALLDTLNQTYLINLIESLDLAQLYETQILATYRGIGEDRFAREFRRECLREPLRLMLHMQAIYARANGTLSEAACSLLKIATDAQSARAFKAQGHDLQLLPAYLAPGGSDTDNRPTTLSGVTFIHDRASKLTLLYLPDHPLNPVLSYNSLESARTGLYELSKQSGMDQYLASRALLGDPDRHVQRIREAIERGFDALIGVGVPWPSTTSLAQHLFDAHQGRVLEAHRATSRSNQTLWLENFAYQSGMIFNYLKIALGLVPFVGTAIALYDFFDASATAAKALIAGEVGKSLDALEQALLALTDAAVDLLPGAGKAASVRRVTLLRQQRKLTSGALTVATGNYTLERAARFAGYEHASPPSLLNLTPATQGRYRGIYQHADGDFVLVAGRTHQVTWDTSLATWRLKGTRLKGYQQAIALGLDGQWDTHGHLYGLLAKGAGGGGGGSIGRLRQRPSVPVHQDVHGPYDLPQIHREALQQAAIYPRAFKPGYQILGDPANEAAHHAHTEASIRLETDSTAHLARPERFPRRPRIPTLAADASGRAILNEIYASSSGLVIGEVHSSIASKQFLIDNMAALSDLQIKTLYLEHLLNDLHAVDIARFNRRGRFSDTLKEYLQVLDSGHRTDSEGIYTFQSILEHAHKHGIRIQALDSLPSYRIGEDGDRIKLFNFHAQSIIRLDQQLNPGKWIALVGNSHVNTFNATPGVSELSGAIGLYVRDAPAMSTPSVGVDLGGFFRKGMHLEFKRVQADLRLNLPTRTGTVIRVDDSKLSRAGDFSIGPEEEKLVLVHLSHNHERVRTPIEHLDNGRLRISRPTWPSVDQVEYRSLPGLVSALNAMGMRLVH